ncbi:MAG: acetyl-CoA carboxylase biotin carboxylase subunit family protein [Planctomycetota bacterium]
MPNVVFVAPFVLEATRRFVHAAAALPGTRLVLVTQEPAERLSESLRADLGGHYKVDNALDAQQIVDAVRSIAKRVGPVARVIGMLEQLQVPLAEARAALGLPGLAPDAARGFRDKSVMKDRLRQSGIPCARHCLAATAAMATQFAREQGFPLVVKPPAGAGAKSTFRVDNLEQLSKAIELYRPAPGREMLLEEFLVGEEHSFDCVFVRGRPVWFSLSRYLPSPLEVLETPWIQWCVLLPRHVDGPEYAAIREVGPRAIATLGLETGVAHMEWFRRPNGTVAISEVGARPPGAQFCSLISYAHDVDFYRAWAQLAVYESFDPPTRRWSVGGAYFRGQGAGRVTAVEGVEQAQRELGSLVVEARLPRVGQGRNDSYEGEGYAILRHPETAVVERALRRIVEVVQVKVANS